MSKIVCQIVVDKIQKFMTLPIIEKDGNLFVANPLADRPHQPALVLLDPKHIVKPPDVEAPFGYTKVLLESRTLPEV